MSLTRHDYRIAIPTYHREQTLIDKTLAMLRGTRVDLAKVDLFVADRDQYTAYVQAMAAVRIGVGDVVIAEPGVAAVRRRMVRHYPEGQLLVHLDDDIQGVFYRRDAKTLEPVAVFDDVVQAGFDAAAAAKARLWGVYPVCNPFFMRSQVRVGLSFIIGTFFGSVNDHSGVLEVDIDDKDDVLRSLQCYVADGAVARLDHVTFKTRFLTEPGGMQWDGLRNDEANARNAEEIARRYPQLCSVYRRKNGRAEVRLRATA